MRSGIDACLCRTMRQYLRCSLKETIPTKQVSFRLFLIFTFQPFDVVRSIFFQGVFRIRPCVVV